jgi:hypothetical protein
LNRDQSTAYQLMFLNEGTMSEPSRRFRIGAVIWAISLSGLVLFLTGSVLLPSTKRAHLDFQRIGQPTDGGNTAAKPATQP